MSGIKGKTGTYKRTKWHGGKIKEGITLLVKNKTSKKMIKLWQDKNYREKQVKVHTGRKMPKSQKNKISESLRKGKKTTKYKEYIYIYSPNHPYKNKNNYVFEHRLVMENYIGRYLTKEEVVHHINGIRDNNKIENLMLFPNRRAHHLFRHLGKRTFICKFCKKNQGEINV